MKLGSGGTLTFTAGIWGSPGGLRGKAPDKSNAVTPGW